MRHANVLPVAIQRNHGTIAADRAGEREDPNRESTMTWIGVLMALALIVGVFRNGLTLMGVSSVYQILITGILVILAVAADQLSRRRSA